MLSTNIVDYSTRKNKAITRDIVFDGLRQLGTKFEFSDYTYVGLGSVWFVDFDIAHRVLGIDSMVSIEADDITFSRAKYNRPYKTVDVVHGWSNEVIPSLFGKHPGPWVVWLDYDETLDAKKFAELETITDRLEPGSVLLVTFSGSPGRYGKPKARRLFLEELFGNALSTDKLDLAEDKVEFLKGEADLARILSESALNYIQEYAVSIGRQDRCLEAFRLTYRDGTPMVTFGVIFVDETSSSAVREVLSSENWQGRVEGMIQTPPLTAKEVATLRSLLPNNALAVADVESAGFKLSKEQLDSFVQHYQRYPTFFQSVR